MECDEYVSEPMGGPRRSRDALFHQDNSARAVIFRSLSGDVSTRSDYPIFVLVRSFSVKASFSQSIYIFCRTQPQYHPIALSSSVSKLHNSLAKISRDSIYAANFIPIQFFDPLLENLKAYILVLSFPAFVSQRSGSKISALEKLRDG